MLTSFFDRFGSLWGALGGSLGDLGPHVRKGSRDRIPNSVLGLYFWYLFGGSEGSSNDLSRQSEESDVMSGSVV